MTLLRKRFVILSTAAVMIAGCTAKEQVAEQKPQYPAPRWPSYFKPPKSVDDLMPAARLLVRNKSGFLGVGMGVVQSGETILIVPNLQSDPMVVQAVVKALAERGVTAQLKYTYELMGQTREEAQRLEEQEHRGRRIADAG